MPRSLFTEEPVPSRIFEASSRPINRPCVYKGQPCGAVPSHLSRRSRPAKLELRETLKSRAVSAIASIRMAAAAAAIDSASCLEGDSPAPVRRDSGMISVSRPAQLVGTGVDEPGVACSVNPTVRVPFVRSSRLAWWSTGPRCGPTDDSSAPCWSVYTEDRLTGRLTPCGN